MVGMCVILLESLSQRGILSNHIYSNCDLPSNSQNPLPRVDPLLPPHRLTFSQHSACSTLPLKAWQSSDLLRHHHLPKAVVLWRRLSYPRVPAVGSPLSLCSYGSVTIEQCHMGALHTTLPHPPWFHQTPFAHPTLIIVFQRDQVRLFIQTIENLWLIVQTLLHYKKSIWKYKMLAIYIFESSL